MSHRLKMNTTEYKSWINKEEKYVDKLTEVNINRLHYTLNLQGSPPALGEPVFPLALLLLGEPSVRPEELGEDGHPARGGFMPPVPLKRRMFAGGDYEFFQPLNVGEDVHVSWKITNIIRKQGSNGELVFVDILKEFKVNKQLCATENRHIVYTDSKPKTSQTEETEMPGEWEEIIKNVDNGSNQSTTSSKNFDYVLYYYCFMLKTVLRNSVLHYARVFAALNPARIWDKPLYVD